MNLKKNGGKNTASNETKTANRSPEKQKKSKNVLTEVKISATSDNNYKQPSYY